MEQLLDGLMIRVRPQYSEEPCCEWPLEQHEYDFMLALAQMYFRAKQFLADKEIDRYALSGLATAAYTLMHVARTFDPNSMSLIGNDSNAKEFQA